MQRVLIDDHQPVLGLRDQVAIVDLQTVADTSRGGQACERIDPRGHRLRVDLGRRGTVRGSRPRRRPDRTVEMPAADVKDAGPHGRLPRCGPPSLAAAGPAPRAQFTRLLRGVAPASRDRVRDRLTSSRSRLATARAPSDRS